MLTIEGIRVKSRARNHGLIVPEFASGSATSFGLGVSPGITVPPSARLFHPTDDISAEVTPVFWGFLPNFALPTASLCIAADHS